MKKGGISKEIGSDATWNLANCQCYINEQNSALPKSWSMGNDISITNGNSNVFDALEDSTPRKGAHWLSLEIGHNGGGSREVLCRL